MPETEQTPEQTPEQTSEQKPFELEVEGAASLTGYQAVAKKEDLLVYEKLIFTVKEDGYPTILSHFDPKLAANPNAWSVKYPHDELCHIIFDGQDIRGELSEIACSRKTCEEGGTNTYKFAIVREMTLESINHVVVPYFKAREEQTVEKPKTQWSKGGLMTETVSLTYPFRITI